jgi:hypothetical protein
MDQYVMEDAARYRWLRADGINWLEHSVLDSAVVIADGDKLDREVDVKRQGVVISESTDPEADAARYRLIRGGMLWSFKDSYVDYPPIFPTGDALDKVIDALRGA